jgi:hypothetical protein
MDPGSESKAKIVILVKTPRYEWCCRDLLCAMDDIAKIYSSSPRIAEILHYER